MLPILTNKCQEFFSDTKKNNKEQFKQLLELMCLFLLLNLKNNIFKAICDNELK